MKQKQVNYIKNVNIYKPELPLWLGVLLRTIFISFIICCAFVAVFCFIYIYTPVDGPSMLPTLNSQCYDENLKKIDSSLPDYVYINRFASSDYGDIIVAKNPSSNYVVKRLIAKGGDRIAIVKIGSDDSPVYKIVLNKKDKTTFEELEETYLPSNTSLEGTFTKFQNYLLENKNKTETLTTRFGATKFLKLKDDEIFYLGDNREKSTDCSEYGPIPSSNYIGRVDIVVHEGKNSFSTIFLYFWHKIFG